MAKESKFKSLANRAAKRTDQTQTKTGGGEFTPPPAGTTVGRLVDYVEVGLQKQKPYLGKDKPPANKVYVTFELLGKKYIREVEVDGKKKQVADRITIPLTLSLHEKSSFKKLFKKMTYGRQDINHMAQMLGEAFKITVVHNESGEGDKKRVYANITDEDGAFLVSAPVMQEVDEEGNVTGTKKLAVPEAISPERLFLWEEPTEETWNSIFIDGEKEVTDEKGKKKTVSKNWLQNMITSALNFEGSPIQAFLEGSEDLPENPEELDEEEEAELEEELEELEEEEEEVEEAPAKKPVAAKKTAASAPAKTTSTAKTAKAASPSKVAPAKKKAAPSEDPLKALGLA